MTQAESTLYNLVDLDELDIFAYFGEFQSFSLSGQNNNKDR